MDDQHRFKLELSFSPPLGPPSNLMKRMASTLLSMCSSLHKITQVVRLLNDTEIAKAKRDFELKKAAYDVEVQTKVMMVITRWLI